MTSEMSTPSIVVRFVIMFVVVSAAFFASAGTLNWPEAWLYMILQFSFLVKSAVWLKRHNPDLLKDRLTFIQPSARGWDRTILRTSNTVAIPFLLLPGLDAIRYQWTSVPLTVEVLGFTGIVAALLLIAWVRRENTYLYLYVKIQEDRGHRVIDTGPYRYVRHPYYVGLIIMYFCIPLALGSLLTLIPGALLTALLVIRTRLEDKTLQSELGGYREYSEKVRYRLVPGIW